MSTEAKLKQEKWWDKRGQKWRFYPHLTCRNNKDGKSQCVYCGEVMRQDDKWVYFEEISCTERKQPCQWCGESPLCAPNCVGIRMILSDPEVYVTGDNPFD